MLVVTAVYWTREVAAAMASTEKGRLQACADSNTAQLTDIISLVGEGREGEGGREEGRCRCVPMATSHREREGRGREGEGGRAGAC